MTVKLRLEPQRTKNKNSSDIRQNWDIHSHLLCLSNSTFFPPDHTWISLLNTTYSMWLLYLIQHLFSTFWTNNVFFFISFTFSKLYPPSLFLIFTVLITPSRKAQANYPSTCFPSLCLFLLFLHDMFPFRSAILLPCPPPWITLSLPSSLSSGRCTHSTPLPRDLSSSPS